MHCPFCQTPLKADAAECPACRLSYARTSSLLGPLPRFSPVVADTTRQLKETELDQLRGRIKKVEDRFPQLILNVVMHHFPAEHPFAMHAFWLFNASNYAGNSRRGSSNHALLLAVDPARGESAIIPGYGLEDCLKTEALDQLLHLASPAWKATRWAEGIAQVIDGLDQLLESIAIPEVIKTSKSGDY